MTTDGTPDSRDIRVRRCTVRVRRRDGWGWGDPGDYLNQVRAAIERALGGAAAEAGIPAGVDAVVTEPVTLHVGPDGEVRPSDRRALTDLLRAAAREVAVAPRVATADVSVAPRPTTVDLSAGGAALASLGAMGEGLAAALGAWSRAGRLATIVSGWTAVARSSWLRALVEAVGTSADGSVDEQSVVAIAEAVLPSSAAEARPAADVRALVLAGAVVAAAGDRLPDRQTLRSIRRVAGLDPDEQAEAPPGARPATPAGSVAGTDARTSSSEDTPTRTGPSVVPALPLLLVVQLGRLGYLEPAAAAFAVSGLSQSSAMVAAMLAGKILPPPTHGWLRTPAGRDAVRLASGLDDEVVDAEISALVPRADAVLGPLASVLVGLHATDRSRFADVVVTRTRDAGTIVGEAAGRLPIGWIEEPGELAAVLAQLGDPPVLEDGLFTDLVERLAPRRALPGLAAEGLERHLGAAVGTGLGSLAQDLWGESADSVLALDRLGDLKARAEVTDRLTIGIPRGQRWLDLKRAGLIDAWPVPWAPGGLWELVTW